MIRRFLLIASLGLLLSACTIPMNPDEYRQAAKAGNALSTFESFDVNRPLSEVAATFKAKAAECLDYRLGSTSRPVIGIGSTTHYYAVAMQTVRKSKDKVELYFQVKYENTLNKEPEGGSYHLVADAYSVGKKTRVDVYRRTKVGVLTEMLKGWATGDNLGCADPAQYL
jgi:hypothetical protein